MYIFFLFKLPSFVNKVVCIYMYTYVIVPATNSDTSTSELRHVQVCAEENSLKLNCSILKKLYSAAVRHVVSQQWFLFCAWTCAKCTVSQRLASCSMTSWLQPTTSVCCYHPAQIWCACCEYFVITDYQPVYFKTYTLYHSHKNYILFSFLVWPSVRQMIVQYWMHSCDAASIIDTASVTFQQHVNCLLQLISLCLSDCCCKRPITVTT